jgi:hypothetical protein
MEPTNRTTFCTIEVNPDFLCTRDPFKEPWESCKYYVKDSHGGCRSKLKQWCTNDQANAEQLEHWIKEFKK